MDDQDDICYCYHVPLGKLVHFTRRTRPRHPSQLSECLGAGTGCGWCIPMLKQIFADCQNQVDPTQVTTLTPDEYAAARDAYRKSQTPRHTF